MTAPTFTTPMERLTQGLPWRSMGGAFLSLGLGVLLAYGLRHGLVEPAEFTHRCEAAPDSSALCSLRQWTVTVFVHQRLAWAALMLAVISAFMCWRVHTWTGSTTESLRNDHGAMRYISWSVYGALFLGGAGLVLYAADVASLAVLIALHVALHVALNSRAAGAAPLSLRSQHCAPQP